MDQELAMQIIKWTAIVFAAGFIGYFGRYLSMQVIDRMRKKKAAENKGEQKGPMGKYEYKLEKRKAKAEKKKAKARKKK